MRKYLLGGSRGVTWRPFPWPGESSDAGRHGTGWIGCVCLRAVVNKMCTDEVARGEGTEERQLSSHNRRGDDTSKALGIHTGRRWVGTSDTEHIQHRTLGGKDGTATDGADFDARHGNGHQKILSVISPVET